MRVWSLLGRMGMLLRLLKDLPELSGTRTISHDLIFWQRSLIWNILMIRLHTPAFDVSFNVENTGPVYGGEVRGKIAGLFFWVLLLTNTHFQKKKNRFLRSTWISQLPLVNPPLFWKGLPTLKSHRVATIVLASRFRGMICRFGMWYSKGGGSLKVKLVSLLERVAGIHGYKALCLFKKSSAFWFGHELLNTYRAELLWRNYGSLFLLVITHTLLYIVSFFLFLL